MKNLRILIVDDEEKIAILTADALKDEGYDVEYNIDPQDALIKVQNAHFDLIISDLKMKPFDGISLLQKIKKINSDIDFVIMTAHASVETAVEALKMGAYDYIIKPFGFDELNILVERIAQKRTLLMENKELKKQIRRKYSIDEIIGTSEKISELKGMIQKISSSDATVFLNGESGTGKELVARAIHGESSRYHKPFIAVNCSAFTTTLLDSELFGSEKGAFTGAHRTKVGLFEAAHGGTLFLDEIGDVGHEIQAKLLRVLQEKEIRRVGSAGNISVNVRIITATNKDIPELIKNKEFREDLYFRLNVFPILIPPLRSRDGDIRILTEYFFKKYNVSLDRIDKNVLKIFEKYSWPGNVRELENIVERLTLLAGPDKITSHYIPEHLVSSSPKTTFFEFPEEGIVLDDLERDLIFAALKKANWNKTNAAKLLGITRRRLYSKLESFDLTDEEKA